MMKKDPIVSADYRIRIGTLSLLVGIIMSVLSGFDFYNPDSGVVWALLTLGSALIGVGIVKQFVPNNRQQYSQQD
jgi:hypothetical protein